MKERIASITGVSRGFGLELTREYCRLGWRVFGVLRSKEDGAQLSSGNLDHIPLSYGMRMAKAAQNMLSASLHRELRGTGIAIFAVHPGKIRTRMGSPDAEMSAQQAAKRFVNWLPKIRQEREFGYFEAGAEELPF